MYMEQRWILQSSTVQSFPGSILVSFDVEGFYSNITHEYLLVNHPEELSFISLNILYCLLTKGLGYKF